MYNFNILCIFIFLWLYVIQFQYLVYFYPFMALCCTVSIFGVFLHLHTSEALPKTEAKCGVIECL